MAYRRGTGAADRIDREGRSWSTMRTPLYMNLHYCWMNPSVDLIMKCYYGFWHRPSGSSLQSPSGSPMCCWLWSIVLKTKYALTLPHLDDGDIPASSVVALLLDYLIHRKNKNYTVASDQRKQHSTRCAIDEPPCPLDGVHVPTSCCSKRAWSIFIKLHIQGNLFWNWFHTSKQGSPWIPFKARLEFPGQIILYYYNKADLMRGFAFIPRSEKRIRRLGTRFDWWILSVKQQTPCDREEEDSGML